MKFKVRGTERLVDGLSCAEVRGSTQYKQYTRETQPHQNQTIPTNQTGSRLAAGSTHPPTLTLAASLACAALHTARQRWRTP